MTNPAPVDKPPTIKLLERAGSPLGYMIRDFLHRSDIPFEWIELTSDEQARKLAGVDSLNDSRLPVWCFQTEPIWSARLSGRSPKSWDGSAILPARNTTWPSMAPDPPG